MLIQMIIKTSERTFGGLRGNFLSHHHMPGSHQESQPYLGLTCTREAFRPPYTPGPGPSDGEFTLKDTDKVVKVNRDGFIGLAIQVYFATCLFSLYFQLKNKEEVQKRDAEAAEMTFVKKNTAGS